MIPAGNKLFNTIVILGAALVGGCGGGSSGNTEPSASPNSKTNGSLPYVVPKDAGTSDGGWTGW